MEIVFVQLRVRFFDSPGKREATSNGGSLTDATSG